jgi:hypothetical protein
MGGQIFSGFRHGQKLLYTFRFGVIKSLGKMLQASRSGPGSQSKH